jgi:hypothetical protein
MIEIEVKENLESRHIQRGFQFRNKGDLSLSYN